MPKFTITEQIPCVQIWTYEIEAETETEALEVVLNGTEPIESTVTGHDYEQATYEIEDEEGSVMEVEKVISEDMSKEEIEALLNMELKDYDDIQDDNDEDEYDGESWDMQSR